MIAPPGEPPNTPHDPETVMNDLLYIAIFAGCCTATWALAALCQALTPGKAPESGSKR